MFLYSMCLIYGKKRWIRNLLLDLSLAGCLGFASFMVCYVVGTYSTPVHTYEEYPIQTLTKSRMYFNNECYRLSGSNIVIEEPKKNCENMVIVDTENYEIQWFIKVHASAKTYHIYLSNENYIKLQMDDLIYDIREETGEW